MKIKTSELEGAALDWAVAHATKAWETAHEMFPTWTLDPTFSGVQPMVYSDGQVLCQLIPSNPMRQDPQIYRPSTDWSQGGPIIEREDYALPFKAPFHRKHLGKYQACTPGGFPWNGDTPLIASCRAIVAAKVGEHVDLPDGLIKA